jgi:hypothetical protein
MRPVRSSSHCAQPPDPPHLAGTPDPKPWAAKLAICAAQVTRGSRPAAQLHRWVSRDIYDHLRAKSQLTARLSRGRPAPRIHLRIRYVRVCRPVDGVAEAAVVLHDGDRPRAVAMRLEWRQDRWLAQKLEFL